MRKFENHSEPRQGWKKRKEPRKRTPSSLPKLSHRFQRVSGEVMIVYIVEALLASVFGLNDIYVTTELPEKSESGKYCS